MAGLFDMLGAALGANAAAQNPSVTQASAAAPPTEDDPDSIVVHAKPPPPRTPVSAYDNTADVQALRGVNDADASIPHPRSIYAGHGTLGNVLGILGDAFLVNAGKQPAYLQQLQRQKEADAMAGFQDNPGVAASRVAATAVPGAIEDATKLYDTSQVMGLRRDEQANLNQYRTNQTQDREAVLHDRAIQQSTPFIGGMLQAGAQAEAQGQTGAYAKAYQRAKTYAAGRGLDIAQDFGAPDQYQDFQAGYGQTARQQTQGAISQSSVDERANAAGLAHQDRVASRGQSGAIAAQRDATARRGQDLRTKTPISIPGLTVGGGGQRPIPTATDRAYAQAHPESRAAFQQHFGIAP